MRACERSRIQTEVQKGAPFLYDIGTSCNMVAIWNVSLCTTFHNAFGTVPATHELTVLFYLGISLSSSVTLSLILWYCGAGGSRSSDWSVPLLVGSCVFMDVCL